MSQIPESPDALPALLQGFILGDRAARDRLPRLITPQLRAKVRRLAPQLAADLVDDVVSEAWVALLANPAPFDPTRGSAWSYLHWIIQNALKRVRANYASPGEPKRQRGRACPVAPAAPLEDALDEPEHGAERRVEAHAAANEVLRRAPIDVRRGLWLTAVHGFTLTEAAAKLKTNRFRLARRLERAAEIIAA